VEALDGVARSVSERAIFDDAGWDVTWRIIGCRECTQVVPEAVGVAIGEETLNREVRTLPDGNGLREEFSPLWRQRHQAAATVGRVHCNVDQRSAL
jgi:hypothetical protein